MKTIFGPVPSRRLGRSLGIDVIPPKTCSYDCIYCESGRTTRLTIERGAFVNPDDVLHDLEDYFLAHPDGADVLTFSSGGEPTLFEPLGRLIRAVKKRFPTMPLVLLTNGSLLWDPQVRRDLMLADRVVPSLDGATEESFIRVNRPHPMLRLPAIIEGLEAFRGEYKGQFHLEVMLVDSHNDSPEELKAIRRVIDRLDPHEVELNTVVRPPADPDVRGLSRSLMEEALGYFPKPRTKIIGHFERTCGCVEDHDLDQRVLEVLKRRPCRTAELSVSLGASIQTVHDTIERLVSEGRLMRTHLDGDEFLKFPEARRRSEKL